MAGEAAGHGRSLQEGFLAVGGGAATGADVVLDGFQGGALLRSALGKLDQGLYDPGEQLVAPESM